MSEWLRCPQGHTWACAGSPPATSVCPECGAAAVASGDSSPHQSINEAQTVPDCPPSRAAAPSRDDKTLPTILTVPAASPATMPATPPLGESTRATLASPAQPGAADPGAPPAIPG